MHPFKQLCKHALHEIENKHDYHKEDFDACGGLCWKCNEPLTLSKRQPITLDQIDMDDASRESLKDPKQAALVLESFNQLTWRCVPCFKALMRERMKGPFLTSEEAFARIKDKEKWNADLRAKIQEIEACGENCPYWDHLPQYRKNIE